MALSPQDKEQVRNVGLLCVLAVGFLVMGPFSDYGVGIKHLTDAIKRQERLLKEEEADLREEEARIDRIDTIKTELAERAPEIERYEARLPKDKQVPELFRDIDRFKQQAGLDIVVQTRLEPVNHEEYIDLPIRVEARGTYDSIATFINLLERNQRFAKIKEVQIAEVPGENREEEGTIDDLAIHDAVMVISTFMFVNPEDRPQQDEKGPQPAATPARS
jgi:Tfp pilus assembly protein PilO